MLTTVQSGLLRVVITYGVYFESVQVKTITTVVETVVTVPTVVMTATTVVTGRFGPQMLTIMQSGL